MVRGNLRLWIGVAAFALLVAGLATIALMRESGPSLHGHWRLSAIETPEGTFTPATDDEWIEFDEEIFRGRMECIEFDGEFIVAESGRFELGGWGFSTACEQLEGTGYAFDQYFGLVSEYDLGGDLVLESADATVRFSFVTEGG